MFVIFFVDTRIIGYVGKVYLVYMCCGYAHRCMQLHKVYKYIVYIHEALFRKYVMRAQYRYIPNPRDAIQTGGVTHSTVVTGYTRAAFLYPGMFIMYLKTLQKTVITRHTMYDIHDYRYTCRWNMFLI